MIKLSPADRVALEKLIGVEATLHVPVLLEIAVQLAKKEGSPAERIVGGAFTVVDYGLSLIGFRPHGPWRSALRASEIGLTALVGAIVGVSQTDAEEMHLRDNRP